MRLLQRPPETPSLETWLSRDVPHERELAGELLEQLGRKKAVEALLRVHDSEEAKREKWRVVRLRIAIALGLAWIAVCVAGAPWFHLMPFIYWQIAAYAFFVILAVLHVTNAIWPNHKLSRRQNNSITALFNYADDPRVADTFCRALSAYTPDDTLYQWVLYQRIKDVLPLLPDDKDALTKEARAALRDRLVVIESGGTPNITPELQRERAFYADWEIAVLQYFVRTRDTDALRAIRRSAKANTYSDDGVRVREAARAALKAFGETVS